MNVPPIHIVPRGLPSWAKNRALSLALLLIPLAGVARAQDTAVKSAAPMVPNNAASAGASATRQHLNPAAKMLGSMLATTIRDPATDLFSGLFPEAANDRPQPAENLRPFLLTLPQQHLFGDWWGASPKLDNMGITPTLTYVTDIAGNLTGGKNQGAAYADNIGLNLLFDLNKLAGLEGGSFLVSMSQRDGSSLSQTHVGNVFTIQQDYGGQTFKIIDAAYQQKLLDDRVELRVGRIAAGDDFLVSPYDYLFMQNGFDGNPVGIFFNSPGTTAYPNSAWGGLIKVKPTDRTYVMAGIYDGDSSIRENNYHGVDLSLDGPLFAIAEIGYRRNGLPGRHPAPGQLQSWAAWYDNNSYTDYKTGGARRGNWGVYGLFDQVLVPFAEPGSNRGFGVFGSVLASPDQSISRMPYFFTAGFAFRGIFASRPTDSGGFGIALWRLQQRPARRRGAGVRASTHPSACRITRPRSSGPIGFTSARAPLFFQPDLQYVIRPGGTGKIDDALVAGCQIGINF